jgi:hypothetical protein
MTRQGIGYLLALLGGVLGLIAFFSMPFVSVGFISFTAQQLATYGNQATTLTNQSNQLQLFWLEPVVGLLICLVAGYGLFRSLGVGQQPVAPGMPARADQGMLIAGVITLILGVVASLALMVLYAQAAQGFSTDGTSYSLTSFLGSGFWAFLIGMLLAIAGGVMALVPLNRP